TDLPSWPPSARSPLGCPVASSLATRETTAARPCPPPAPSRCRTGRWICPRSPAPSAGRSVPTGDRVLRPDFAACRLLAPGLLLGVACLRLTCALSPEREARVPPRSASHPGHDCSDLQTLATVRVAVPRLALLRPAAVGTGGGERQRHPARPAAAQRGRRPT